MIENMILTSYLDKSYFVASRGGCLMGYVASIQTMLCDKLKHQVGHEFFSSSRFVFILCDKTSCCIAGYVIPWLENK